jgi:hypothetical protein
VKRVGSVGRLVAVVVAVMMAVKKASAIRSYPELLGWTEPV